MKNSRKTVQGYVRNVSSQLSWAVGSKVLHLWQLQLEKTELFKTEWGITGSWTLSKVCAQRQSLQHTKSLATEHCCYNESKYIAKTSKADPKLKNCSFLVNYQAIILTTEPYFSAPLKKNIHHYNSIAVIPQGPQESSGSHHNRDYLNKKLLKLGINRNE